MLAQFYQNTILKNPKSIFVVLFLVLISFGYYSKDFRLDASSETLLIEGDPDLEYLREITDFHPLAGAVQHRERNVPAVVGVFQGVFQEIQQHLAHAALISENLGQVSRNIGFDFNVAPQPQFFELEDHFC